MRKIRILWTDDEIDHLKPHILFLEDKGYEIVTANNGDDAIDLVSSQKFDIIFLDGFSTTKNPELWTYDFIKSLSKVISNIGVIVTYSAAFSVRGAFVRNNLSVGLTEPFGRKNGGTIASKNIDLIKKPLTEKDMNIIAKSTAGTPYRDPSLNWTKKKIISYRSDLIKKLKNMGIPKWYK